MAVRSKDDDLHYPGFANDAKEWIDGKVYGGMAMASRGALQVLGAGFGKGALVAAAIITTAIMVTTLAAPVAGFTLGQSIELGLSRVLMNLFSLPSLTVLAAGGAAGSMVAAHSENTRMNKRLAEMQAQAFSAARTSNEQLQQQVDNPCIDVPGGHCARLMQQNDKQQGYER